MFRTIQSGVNGTPAGDELKVEQAFEGLAVTVNAGQAMVQGHFYINTLPFDLPLQPADGSLDRIDTIVLELDDVSNSITGKVVTGEPASEPEPPTLTQTEPYGVWQERIADVLVQAASGVPGTITDRRAFMGERVGTWTTANRPDTNGRPVFGYNSTLDAVEFYDGDEWRPLAPEINSLNDIGDVDITTPTDGDLLVYDDGDWVNQALATDQMPTGSILQVVTVEKTDTFTTSSLSFTDVTGLSVSITPTADTSKILVFMDVKAGSFHSGSSSATHLQLLRASTVIGSGVGAGSRVAAIATVLADARYNTSVDIYSEHSTVLDSPATASSVTYKVQARAAVSGDLATINRAGDDNDTAERARVASRIILMEVAG
jgi:hypothetical protein